MSGLLDLPFPIWSSLAATGLNWVKTILSVKDDTLNKHIVKVEYLGRYFTLAFEHDGEQYRLVNAGKRFPKFLAAQLDWQLAIELHIKQEG